ncbi:MAG: bifunctional phosphopantothenoylcysteine decarboxylase/phosphopantothenate--cysteine ligase CoaBC [Nanoarchaeota archaeon]|nr:bifunctional phosphopantothenoylcysteine decarboxylase/phosphopantothenate--cysteine ligase CoaBC [Nanoarchaeota archaeon]
MRTILVGVSSGIAAFKAVEVVESLKKQGYRVIVLMTDSAKKMVSPKAFEKASGNPALSELFPQGFDYKKVLKERKVEHIQLADSAAVFAIVPATANIIANLAHGIAYDLVTTTALATHAPLLIFPSMNVNMWQHPATRENLATLKQRGAIIIDPDCGDLACGYTGKGRLPAPEHIVEEIDKLAQMRGQLAGKKVVVTAGGTEEAIDDVRVLTNKSSGKMGVALAEECTKRGARVTLIRARTEVEPNVLVRDVRVRSGHEMSSQLRKEVRNADFIFHAAAVSDFTLAKRKGKLDSKKGFTLHLNPAPKIIDEIKKWNSKAALIGFKAESGIKEEKLVASAKRLLLRTKAGLIVANDVFKHPFGSDKTRVVLVGKNRIKKSGVLSKEKIAEAILDEVLVGKAFAPGNASCVFQVYGEKGSPERGSLGVGFTLDKGASVEVRRTEKSNIFVNGKKWEFPTVADAVASLTNCHLEIKITSELPFGCGFGMSGASAFAAALATNQLLNLGKSREELALVAHYAEVKNSTGLGDVAGQYTGGFMMRKRKGKILDVERLPLCPHSIYYKAFGPIETKKVISSAERLKEINKAGGRALSKVSKRSTLKEIVALSKEFAANSGLLTDKRVRNSIEWVEKKGGKASMVMLGNSVFSTLPFPGCKKARIIEKGAHVL